MKEYFVILNHHDDIDRRAIVDAMVENLVTLEASKIVFNSLK